ncbi:MAG TPA: hypothetical protein PLS62_13860 [Desulfobacteraceae bacterium]|nr:hypothetical protein [Desulfobacteraceae bacterium]
MRILSIKFSISGLFFLGAVIFMFQPAHGAKAGGTNWGDIILSPSPQMDLQQVIRVGLPDLESQVQQAFRSSIDKIKEMQKNLEDKTGIKPGMTYEVTLVGAEGNEVKIQYDMLDLAGWDGVSTLPCKVVIEKKDVGAIEVSYDPKAPLGIKEIKVEKKMPGGVASQSGTITVDGTWEKPKVSITYGQKAETPSAGGFKGEAEQTIGLDFSRSADDLYDPEWNPRSEWVIVRAIEDIISMTTWGVKVTGKHEKDIGPGEKLITGVDVSVNTDRVRSWWTDWLFSDMYEAFDRLDEQLEHEAEWRRNKIKAEAIRLGINPDGKTNQQIKNEIKAVWNEHPELRRPIFRNPGPRVNPANLPSGGGRIGTGSSQGAGVPLGTSSPPANAQGGAGQPTGFANPYQGWDKVQPGWDKVQPGWDKVQPGWDKVQPGWDKCY